MLVSIFLFSIKSTFNENQKGRISSFVQASQGKEIKSNTRIYIWKSSFEFIVDRNVFTGAGHQAMNNIVLFDGKWVGPHNFYLWIWGNSGIFVLFIFCFWLGYILYKAFQVADVLSRLVAIILSFSFIGYSFTDHSFLLHQGTGIILFFILFFIVNSPSISNTLENN
jgi:O-antigen ligase